MYNCQTHTVVYVFAAKLIKQQLYLPDVRSLPSHSRDTDYFDFLEKFEKSIRDSNNPVIVPGDLYCTARGPGIQNPKSKWRHFV